MPPNPKDILKHELIGLKAAIVKSKDPNMLQVKGVIVNETQKTIALRCGEKTIITAKKDNTYRITLMDKKEVEIRGKLLYGRPEERIKKKTQSKWKMV